MKRTFAVNIAGYAFTIDENAYTLLNNYLETISCAFRDNEDGKEICEDIELRVAELLLEKISSGSHIVSYNNVEEVIRRIGTPEEFNEEDATVVIEPAQTKEEVEKEIFYTEKKEETITPPPYQPVPPKIKKKLFRDEDNAMLAGVCAGLAWYTGIDLTLLRLITVLLVFLSASTVVIAYIILWIVVPVARTPLQKMQMMGEDPTVENIGKTVTDNFCGEKNLNHENKTQSGLSRFLSNALSVFVKCIFIFCLIIATPVLLIIFFFIIVVILAFFAEGTSLLGGNILGSGVDLHAPGGGTFVLYLLLATVGALITLGIPCWLFFRMTFNKKIKNLSDNNRRSILLLWIIGIVLTSVFTVKTVKKAKQMDKHIFNESIEFNENIGNLDMLNNIDSDDIENITINDGEVSVTTNEGVIYKASKGKVNIEKKEVSDTIKSGEKDTTLQITSTEEIIIEMENKNDSIK